MSSVGSMGAAIPGDFALGEICDLSYGKALPRESRDPDGVFPAVGSAGIVSYTDSALVQEPALVVGRKGNVGSIQVFESGCFPLDTTYVLRPHDQVNLDYLAWALRSKNLVSLDSSTTLPSLRRQDLQAVRLTVPPLDEQKRIVAQLEDQLGKLEAVRARLKVIREQIIQLRASALNENFGVSYSQFEWDSLPLSDVVIPITGKRKTQRGWSPQCESHPALDGQWGVLKTTAVQMGWFEPQQNKALPASLEPKPEVEVSVGDLLLLTTGPRNRCGIPALVDESPGKLMMSGKMIRLRADSGKVLSQWLLLFLLSPHGQSELERLKVGSSDSSVSIGAEVLLKVEVPVPPLEHQKNVVTDLAELSETQRIVEAQVDGLEASLDSARSSILHRAFLAPEEAL